VSLGKEKMFLSDITETHPSGWIIFSAIRLFYHFT
jgi:hypothetical protein